MTATFRSDMTIQLIDSMGSDDSIIRAMLVSTKGSDAVDEEATPGRINFLMANRHGTPFEHASMTFLVEAPIAVFREWHRHRIGQSYNEMSARYKKMEPVFYVPPRERPLVQVGKPGAYRFVSGDELQHRKMSAEIRAQCTHAFNAYERMLDDGIAKEVARGVLPVYLFSSMYVTLNPRALMAFLSLRSTMPGHEREFGGGFPEAVFPSFPMWEIEQCALQMEAAFMELFPMTHEAFRRNGSVCP